MVVSPLAFDGTEDVLIDLLLGANGCDAMFNIALYFLSIVVDFVAIEH